LIDWYYHFRHITQMLFVIAGLVLRALLSDGASENGDGERGGRETATH
jgi:hypothetical protein